MPTFTAERAGWMKEPERSEAPLRTGFVAADSLYINDSKRCRNTVESSTKSVTATASELIGGIALPLLTPL